MRFGGVIAALALTLALAACGGGASPDLSGVAQAAEKTQEAGTARFELTVDAADGEASFSATGAIDYDRQQTEMTMDLGSLASVFGSAKNMKLRMVLDGTVMYMHFPFLAGVVEEGKPWLKVDLEQLAAESGADLGQLNQLSNADPTQALAYLRGAGEFTEVGTESVRGVQTRHYEGTIDLRRALEELPDAQRKQLEAAGIEELPAEAWIDRDGLLRKFTMRFSGEGYAPLAGGLALTMELFDFGDDVEIEIPPQDQVTDLADLKAKGIDQG